MTDQSPPVKDRVIGAKECFALLCAVSVGIGLWQIYQPLPWLWGGGLGLALVWQSVPRPPKAV